MRRIFGRKETAPPPTLDEATGKLTGRGDTLDEKIRKLDQQLIQHRETIRRTRPGPAQDAAKRRALVVMKQKKLYESQRSQLYNQQFNVEQAAFAIQSVQDSAHTVKAMAAATKELRGALKNNDLKITNIERMQDQMQDLLDTHNEIQDVLGASYATPDDVDEGEMMDELEALEADFVDEQATAETGVAGPSYLDDLSAGGVHDAGVPAAPAQAAQVGSGGGGGGRAGGGMAYQEPEYPAVPPMPQRS